MNKDNKRYNTVDKVKSLVIPIIERLDLILWDVCFEKQGPDWFLRVTIDKPFGNVSLNDCENVSRPLDSLLDEEDFIEHSYFLEVSSPGLNRTLKYKEHFERFIGSEVIIKSIRPIDGERDFIGELISFNDGIIKVCVDFKNLEFDISQCSYIKLNDEIDMKEHNNE